MSLIDLPIGSIIAWENASIPAGWAQCDGNNGTPDLRDKFVYGAAVDGDVRGTGGADTHTHTNPSTSTRADHDHGGSKGLSVGSASQAQWSTVGTGVTVSSKGHTHTGSATVTAAGSHSHTVGDTAAASSLPLHVKRVFIRRNS